MGQLVTHPPARAHGREGELDTVTLPRRPSWQSSTTTRSSTKCIPPQCLLGTGKGRALADLLGLDVAPDAYIDARPPERSQVAKPLPGPRQVIVGRCPPGALPTHTRRAAVAPRRSAPSSATTQKQRWPTTTVQSRPLTRSARQVTIRGFRLRIRRNRKDRTSARRSGSEGSSTARFPCPVTIVPPASATTRPDDAEGHVQGGLHE